MSTDNTVSGWRIYDGCISSSGTVTVPHVTYQTVDDYADLLRRITALTNILEDTSVSFARLADRLDHMASLIEAREK